MANHATDVIIRPATEADAAAVAAIHVASWRDAYADILSADYLNGPIESDRLALWSERFRDASPSQLVDIACDPTGQLFGFVCGYRDCDPRWGSLVDNLHVLPGARGQGVGERLLRGAAGRFAAQGSRLGLHLWVFEANVAALRFYQRHGGRVVETNQSHMPAAGGKPVLRVHWPSLAQLT
jgi:ribosomal protein S18 acetylase RimI-like enzyme